VISSSEGDNNDEGDNNEGDNNEGERMNRVYIVPHHSSCEFRSCD
jgi:hypothetical protein